VFEGYVNSTNVAVFDICLENVLSNIMAYIPPFPAVIGNVPFETLSASHFPNHVTEISPRLCNFSGAVEVSLRELKVPFVESLLASPSKEGAISVVSDDGT
jgi:hypothetical protein